MEVTLFVPSIKATIADLVDPFNPFNTILFQFILFFQVSNC